MRCVTIQQTQITSPRSVFEKCRRNQITCPFFDKITMRTLSSGHKLYFNSVDSLEFPPWYG